MSVQANCVQKSRPASEHFQEKWEAVFRQELREKSGTALALYERSSA